MLPNTLDRRKLRVLVADDNQDAALAMTMLLDRYGFNVIATVFDGAAALDCILAERPHVAILDIALPRMDGIEVAELSREECQGLLRLVAVTGLSNTCDRVDAMQAGFDAYFTKPVEGKKLEELLLAYLAGILGEA